MDWYNILNIEEIDSPALIVFPDRVEENIRLLVKMTGDAGRLRPHVKTHKAIEPAIMMMKHGINKFKCATIAEAEVLGMAAAGDVLLAYQPVGPKIKRFISLMKKFPATRFSCLVDNDRALDQISQSAGTERVFVPVYIDLNVGMNRTGILPGKDAYDLYKKCLAAPGIQFMGFHAYDGHIHDESLELRQSRCFEAFAPVEALLERIRPEEQLPVTLIAGGTPTFPIHCQYPGRECSPGTFIYWDQGYQEAFSEQPFLISAIIVTRVVSLPAEGYLCLDLGYKSIASEKPLEHRFTLLNTGSYQVVGQSEEHVVIDMGKGHRYQTGDVIYLIPQHICPTVALYEKAYTATGNLIKGEWKILARDRRIQC